MIKLSFITDEVTQDLSEAIAFARDHDLQGVELRSVDDTPIDEISVRELQEYHQKISAANLQVPNLAGSFYKCDIGNREAIQENFGKLERLCDAADIFGCHYIRGFTFFAPKYKQINPEELTGYFEAPARLLKKRGKVLLLEADPSVNTSNHAAVARLLDLLDHETFGAIYDPGNDIYDPYRERPYPEGYEAVKKYIRHIHIKDAAYDVNGEPKCVKIGSGLVRYPDLLKRLLKDGYGGWLSLETHYRKNVTLTEEQMRNPQGSAFTNGGVEATAESVDAMKMLLTDARKEL